MLANSGSEAFEASGVTRRPGLLQRLRHDRSGNVSMLFGLALIPLTAIVGLAVDFGRVYAVKSHTQSALDAAVLAAGRVAQVEKGSASTVADKTRLAATAYFNQSKPSGVVDSAIQFATDAGNTEFTVTATSWVRSPFLGVLNILFDKAGGAGAPSACQGNYYGCVKLTTTATAALCPSAACAGQNAGGSNVEVAVMLDVTGSMCTPCTKIDALKKAAKDLIDIVVWDDQSEYTSRIALAPFADAVNVGTTLIQKVRGPVTNNLQSSPQLFTSNSALTNTSNQPTNKWIRFRSVNGSNSNGCTTSGTDNCTWQIHTKCVTERIGVNATTTSARSRLRPTRSWARATSATTPPRDAPLQTTPTLRST